MPSAWVSGSFDDFRSAHIRLLEEAAKLGELHVGVWSDDAVRARSGQPPKFPAAERLYLVQVMRYVRGAAIIDDPAAVDGLPPPEAPRPAICVVDEAADTPARRAACRAQGFAYRVVPRRDLAAIPPVPVDLEAPAARAKVVVTGCFDWFHSGHVRFFEEVAELGALYVVVGHDANIRLLKGAGHPLIPQDERRYVVGAVRFVQRALISSGSGWLDAEPEILRLKPQVYAVNEDGDKPDKRAFCERLGIRYVVLKRTPKPGLPRRQSTALRGF